MDFGIYPPEINSGRMYTGPGLGPMLAAAQAWDGLADELYVAASSYQSVVLSLTAGTWSGPSSASMAAAAAPYVTWLHTTATQAEQTAGQAKAAIAAYEAAFASTVPPPVVAANRSLLMMLVATNILGQNTPAIAATEFHYAEMWAQDAAAMYGYAASSAAATALSPFTSPPQSTNPGGPVGQAAGTSVGNVQSTISAASQAISAAPAAAPAQADPLTALSNLITVFLTAPTDLATIYGIIPMDVLSGPVDFPIAYLGTIAGLRTDDTVSGWVGIEGWPGTGTVAPTDFPAIITSPGPIAASSPTVSAAVGEANTIGALSVPQGWAVAAPAIRPVALTSPIPGVTAAATVETLEFGSGSMLSQTGLAGMIGPTLANTVSTDVARDGRRREMTGKRSAADGKDQVAQCKPRAVVTGVAARLRHLATLRDEGRISGEEFTAQKKRLLGR